jgi:hypothetical protein
MCGAIPNEYCETAFLTPVRVFRRILSSGINERDIQRVGLPESSLSIFGSGACRSLTMAIVQYHPFTGEELSVIAEK